jgi:P27 family predicted phage terminase small subunit
MRRGPKSKPTEMLRLRETFNVTRHGGRLEPLAPGELASLPPPEDFDDLQKQRWAFILANAPRAILRNIDFGLLRLYCILEAASIVANHMQQKLDATNSLPLLVKGDKGTFVLSPYAKEQRRLALTLARLAAELGFSPASRASLSADQDAGDDYSGWEFLRPNSPPAKPSKVLKKKLETAELIEREPEGEA